MEGTYEITMGSQRIGHITVTRQGLYYRFSCRCRLASDGMCRVMAAAGGKEESLGILVPVDGGFGLDTKVAAKRFLPGKPQFRIVPDKVQRKDVFVPVYPEEPFSYLEKLKDAYLARQNGQIGVMIRCVQL
jgi:hypothetical protein